MEHGDCSEGKPMAPSLQTPSPDPKTPKTQKAVNPRTSSPNFMRGEANMMIRLVPEIIRIP